MKYGSIVKLFIYQNMRIENAFETKSTQIFLQEVGNGYQKLEKVLHPLF